MIHEYISDVEARLAFAKRAANHFADHPNHWSYTDGDVETDALLALRWGAGDDCVLVLRIGDLPPTIYGQAIAYAPYTTTPKETEA